MKTQFTYSEFRDFFEVQLKQQMGNDITIKRDGHYGLQIESSDFKGRVSLENYWAAYQQTGKVETIMHYIRQQVAIKQSENVLPDFEQDKERIYPTIRQTKFSEGYTPEGYDGPKITVVKDVLLKGINNVYMFNMPEYFVPILNVHTEDKISEMELKKIAHENLRKQGWTEHVHEETIRSGKVFVYDDADKMYNSQFLEADWTKEHLGDSFYITFPTKDKVLVYVPKRNAKLKDMTLDRQLFIMQTTKYYQTEMHPVSPYLYISRSGELEVLDFVSVTN